MSQFDHQAYQRLRSQSLFLADIVAVFLDGLAPRTRAALVVGQAASLVRSIVEAADFAADSYADVVERMADIGRRLAQMRAEGRAPDQIEWEALRSEIETASARIAGAEEGG